MTRNLGNYVECANLWQQNTVVWMQDFPFSSLAKKVIQAANFFESKFFSVWSLTVFCSWNVHIFLPTPPCSLSQTRHLRLYSLAIQLAGTRQERSASYFNDKMHCLDWTVRTSFTQLCSESCVVSLDANTKAFRAMPTFSQRAKTGKRSCLVALVKWKKKHSKFAIDQR